MKKWYKSKVLWLNMVVGAGAACEANFSLIQKYLDNRVYLILISVIAGINMALRFITSQKLIK